MSSLYSGFVAVGNYENGVEERKVPKDLKDETMVVLIEQVAPFVTYKNKKASKIRNQVLADIKIKEKNNFRTLIQGIQF